MRYYTLLALFYNSTTARLKESRCAFDHKWIVMFALLFYSGLDYQSVISLEVVRTFLRQRRERVPIMQLPRSKLREASSGLLKPITWRTEVGLGWWRRPCCRHGTAARYYMRYLPSRQSGDKRLGWLTRLHQCVQVIIKKGTLCFKLDFIMTEEQILVVTNARYLRCPQSWFMRVIISFGPTTVRK